MLCDVFVNNDETNQLDVVRYFIKLDKNKITSLYSKLVSDKDNNIELIAKLDSLLNNNYNPIKRILTKEELDEHDILLKECVMINIESITPVYAIPGARRIMENNSINLSKQVITPDEKELLFDPILNDNTIINDKLATSKNNSMVRRLVKTVQE